MNDLLAAAPPAPLPAAARLRALLATLGEDLLEREEAVHLALLAALAGEHVLLIGPPGTAKSALARRLHGAFADVRYFERLLTRFSTPEELFGPLSLKALEHDRYERLTEGFLPTAGVAFLDEVFKANSAILNALLTLLNERLFDNGTERRPVPLVAVVAASNEVPADEALHAFYDRFLVRVPVAPVGDDAFAALLALPDSPTAVPTKRPERPAPLTTGERLAVAAAAGRVALGDTFVAACTSLRAWLAARGTGLSDRRWRQVVGLARVAAATEGRGTLEALDLWLAPYVASPTPAELPALAAWFEAHVLDLPAVAAPWLERAVAAFERQLGIEEQMPAEGGDTAEDGAGKLALARAIGLANEGAGSGHGGHGGAIGHAGDGGAPAAAGGMQRIVSERLEARLRKRWGARHVQARVAQVEEVAAQVAAALAQAEAARAGLHAGVATRLWLPEPLVRRWLGRHDAVIGLLAAFAARLQATRAGFAALPVDEGLDGEAPSPVDLEDADAATA